MRMVVDRFEGDKAVMFAENEMIITDRADLPDETREGDVLDFSDEKYTICRQETEERRMNNISKFKELKNRKNI